MYIHTRAHTETHTHKERRIRACGHRRPLSTYGSLCVLYPSRRTLTGCGRGRRDQCGAAGCFLCAVGQCPDQCVLLPRHVFLTDAHSVHYRLPAGHRGRRRVHPAQCDHLSRRQAPCVVRAHTHTAAEAYTRTDTQRHRHTHLRAHVYSSFFRSLVCVGCVCAGG
jgi:hypothetical protein